MPEITFINWLKLNKLSYRTIIEYERYYSRFGNQNLTQQSVNSFLSNNNNTVARAFLKNLKQYTIENLSDELTTDELNKLYRLNLGKTKVEDKPKGVKLIISKEDLSKIEEVLKKEWCKLMLNLQYYCALRTSELFQITLNSFLWEEWESDKDKPGIVNIIGKGGSNQPVLVPPVLMQRFTNYFESMAKQHSDQDFKSYLLFNFLNFNLPKEPKDKDKDEYYRIKQRYIHLNYNHWNELLGSASKKAINKQISTHVLRRSFATFLINNGWNLIEVKEHLRHKDVRTTQIYTQISKEQLSKRYLEVLK